MKYRCTARAVLGEVRDKKGKPLNLGDINLEPGLIFDDANPLEARIIELHPDYFAADNVEAATAAPGEKRTVRR